MSMSTPCFLAGSAAGGVSTLASYPLRHDIMKGTVAKPALADWIKGVMKMGPWKAMALVFAGVTPAILSSIVHNGFRFGLYDFTMRNRCLYFQHAWRFTDTDPSTFAAKVHMDGVFFCPIIWGSIASAISRAAFYPLYHSSGRMRYAAMTALNSPGAPPPSTTLATLRSVFVAEGLRGIYRGVSTGVAVSGVRGGITFFVFENVRAYITQTPHTYRSP